MDRQRTSLQSPTRQGGESASGGAASPPRGKVEQYVCAVFDCTHTHTHTAPSKSSTHSAHGVVKLLLLHHGPAIAPPAQRGTHKGSTTARRGQPSPANQRKCDTGALPGPAGGPLACGFQVPARRRRLTPLLAGRKTVDARYLASTVARPLDASSAQPPSFSLAARARVPTP